MTDRVRVTSPPVDEGALNDERSLVELARTDREAFAVLYRRHVTSVYAYAYRQCGSRDVAEEATSATFERALRAIDKFEWRGGGVRAWLFRITANEVAEIYRRQSRATRPRGQMALRELAVDDVGNRIVEGSENVGDSRDHGAEPAELHRALASLNPRYREAIALRYLGSMTAEDAAVALGCSKAVLAVTLYRGLGALRKAMGASFVSEES